MREKQVGIVRYMIPVILTFLLSACVAIEGVRVGDLQTRSEVVELGDAEPVDVEIRMGAGTLDISGGTAGLLDAAFTYNVEELDPQVSYSSGRLRVEDKSVVNVGIASLFDLDEFRNEWELHLNEDVPMSMEIDLGAGPSNLALGGLSLTSLDINGGAGNAEIDLLGDWQRDLNAKIVAGIGRVSLKLPRDVGVKIDVNTGLGAINASGLARNGSTFTNDAYGVSDVTLRINLDGGAGPVNLIVE